MDSWATRPPRIQGDPGAVKRNTRTHPPTHPHTHTRTPDVVCLMHTSSPRGNNSADLGGTYKVAPADPEEEGGSKMEGISVPSYLFLAQAVVGWLVGRPCG